MKNGISGIFPALLRKTIGRLSGILNKSIAIHVAVTVDPMECCEDMGPKVSHQLKIIGSKEISSCQQNEEWGGINASIILTEWDFLQHGHFATPDFVNDLAWLRVLFRNLFRGL